MACRAGLIDGMRVTWPSDFAIHHKAVSREFRPLSLSVTATERLLESGIRMAAGGVLQSRRYSHPPLRLSTGRILMNASTAWILPS